MDSQQPAASRRTVAIIAAAGLACLAIALPVSGAFAEGDGGGSGNTAAQSQDRQANPYGQAPGPAAPGGAPEGQRSPDHPCPKEQGSNDSSDTAPSGETVAL